MPARVASADETIACERATIESGVSAFELMLRAGYGAAQLIGSRFDKPARSGVMVFVGPGNNGGDGWVVAERLTKAGYSTRVVETAPPRTAESVAAKERAVQAGVRTGSESHAAALVVDALLGTGSTGAPRGEIASAIADIHALRRAGAAVVSLDLPSGLDATTGEHEESVAAAATVTFGVVKRGQLIARDVCGEVTVLDIGLTSSDLLSRLPCLIDAEWVHARIPAIPVSAHKGTRKRLAIVGGGKGMAGAAILAGTGALRSGIGLLRIVCAEESVPSTHAGIPAAIVQTWPRTPEELADLTANTDCIAIGPGLGNSEDTRDLVERILLAWNGPMVLDADALNVFSSDIESLSKLLKGRPSIITPHPAEMARLLGTDMAAVLAGRFEIGTSAAAETGATVLLKGSPTIIFSPSGMRYVSASGTAALATGGSGDVLTGIAATLLAQMAEGEEKSTEAAACAAFIHGRAAERCRFVRGITLEDVLQALPVAWNERPSELMVGTLAELEGHS